MECLEINIYLIMILYLKPLIRLEILVPLKMDHKVELMTIGIVLKSIASHVLWQSSVKPMKKNKYQAQNGEMSKNKLKNLLNVI